jgi:glycosyltransferase involved in cell wall biosynthesis
MATSKRGGQRLPPAPGLCHADAVSRRLRVLQLIKGLDAGGAERLLTTMIRHRDADRFDYEVAYVRDGLDALVPELAGAVHVHALGARTDFDLRWLLRLRRLLTAGEPFDVVHTHLPYPASLCRLVTRTVPPSRRPRLVHTDHSFWPELSTVTKVLVRATSALDDVSVSVSQANRALLPRRIRARSRVLLHGIDLAGAHEAAGGTSAIRTELGLEPGDQLVVTAASLTRQKGYPTLLDAAEAFIGSSPAVVFAAAGTGPLEADLRAKAGGLGDTFRFLGFRPDAVALIAAADVFVLASDWECMPVAVMEAIAVGTPIVATAVGELPALFEDGVEALLVPPGHPGLLAAAIRRITSDPALGTRLAAAAAARAGEFDVRRAATSVEEIYTEVAA